jgi:hypothetical protein
VDRASRKLVVDFVQVQELEEVPTSVLTSKLLRVEEDCSIIGTFQWKIGIESIFHLERVDFVYKL